MLRIAAILLAVLSTSPLFAQKAEAAARALVVGNDNYPDLPRSASLTRSGQDARAIAKTLKDIGYNSVESRVDAKRIDMRILWRKLIKESKSDDVVLFYFSGHGMEVNGRNYLIPSDIPELPFGAGLSEDVLIDRAIDLSRLIEDIRRRSDELSHRVGGGVTGIFIIDASRSNPLRESSTKAIGGAQRGLAPVRAPAGTFVIYSAGVGQEALDALGEGDENPNSLFTRILLPMLERTDLSLSDIAKKVRFDVYRAAIERKVRSGNSPHSQTPAYYDNLLVPINILGKRISPKGRPPELEIIRSSVNRDKLDHTLWDCSSCPEMALVRAGSFLMGSPREEKDRQNNEGPQIRLAIKSFYMGKHEVTKEQWGACVAAKACPSLPSTVRTAAEGRKPVTNVSWYDAQQYIRWLNKSLNTESYRLPTEAEWEYAARAGSDKRYAFGDDEADLCKYANGADTSLGSWIWSYGCNDRISRDVAHVGSFNPNQFKLHDMHGNVWEWVADCWKESYVGRPSDGTSVMETPNCARVARGGSWRSASATLRSAVRNRFSPKKRSPGLGFRIARDISGETGLAREKNRVFERPILEYTK